MVLKFPISIDEMSNGLCRWERAKPKSGQEFVNLISKYVDEK
jgi:hypothetical protein